MYLYHESICSDGVTRVKFIAAFIKWLEWGQVCSKYYVMTLLLQLQDVFIWCPKMILFVEQNESN
jgi:hypothetical protein